MQLPIYKRDGTKSADTIEIPDRLLAGEPNDHAIWLAVRSEEAARHQGTHSTKIRKYVRGGGRKPFRQKGRGMARQGTSRSPLFPGGGTIFGPLPHRYEVKIPDKVKKLARRGALIYKAREDRIRVVEDFTLERPRTAEVAKLFDALGLTDQRILFLTADYDLVLAKSTRNLKRVVAQKADAASTRDLLNCTTILFQRSAVPQLVKVLEHAV
jgi:large subunit ribosomal protein L4